MSRTFRRVNSSFANAMYYMIHPADIIMTETGPMKLRNGTLYPIYRIHGCSSPEEIANRTNFRYYTDNMGGYSAPKVFRKFIHRAERRRVKIDLHEAIQVGLEDEFVDYRAKLPYWVYSY